MSKSLMNPRPQFEEGYDGEQEVQIIEEKQILTASIDKKRRRHTQYVRESQKFERQTEGKKPFLLTVNDSGIPYGPRK